MRRASLASLLVLGGCVSNDADANVVILRNQAITGDECVVGGDPDGEFISSGTVASGGAYVFTPVVQNFATAVDGDEGRRLAFIQGARIDIRFVDEALTEQFAGDSLVRFEVPLSGSISPGGTAGFAFEIVPDELTAQLSPGDLMLVDVRMFGRMDGSGFDGATFRYPVEICDGCGPVDAGPCDTLPEGFEPRVGNPCNAAQDGITDCCSQGTELVCPAPGAT